MLHCVYRRAALIDVCGLCIKRHDGHVISEGWTYKRMSTPDIPALMAIEHKQSSRSLLKTMYIFMLNPFPGGLLLA